MVFWSFRIDSVEVCKVVNDEHLKKLFANAGYWIETNAEIECHETELFIATKEDHKRLWEGPTRESVDR